MVGADQRSHVALRHCPANGRTLELLPLTGPGAVLTEVQGRMPGPAYTREGLADLINSIAELGLLHPVGVERLGGSQEAVSHRLVVGERRLSALRMGATLYPNHPNFASVPALVCPGPLTETERRRWQLAENLAREKLQPGELAAALLLQRCAMLTDNLTAAGVAVEASITRDPDPIGRLNHLEALRHDSGRPDLAVAWRDVLQRLGLEMTPRRASALVAAFKALPRQLSTDLDTHQVALATRAVLARGTGGQAALAMDLWQAVKDKGRPELITAVAREHARQPTLAVDEVVALVERPHPPRLPASAAGVARQTGTENPAAALDHSLLENTITAMRHLVAQLRRGATPADQFATGSLRMLATEINRLLPRPAEATS
ncbi:ParB N-terminal domain-containing protein [Nonomuraea diastatica]|uniref:Chromosome partitioning protein ParB n=1 Tax=Nonomuraea diastatica TaxID=1848329 RepID=A0A4R4W3J4_9ACTN|nr:ParB N-terminal domain-containing protein [Nonomuraea diastatica]TDD13159.1 chromosome partitioning protein ParB [Nonomuraea diastatica]